MKKGKGLVLLFLLCAIGAGLVIWYSMDNKAVAVKTDRRVVFLPGVSGEIEEAEEPAIGARSTAFEGMRIGPVDISGMTPEAAEEAVNSYLESLYDNELTLVAASGNEVKVKVRELGPYWANSDVLEGMSALGEGGDVVERYKLSRDIASAGLEYPLELSCDKEKVMKLLTDKCSIYDTPMENATLTREDGEFKVIEGQPGEGINISESTAILENTLYDKLTTGQTRIELPMEELLPQGQTEELYLVKDLLGSFTTSFSSSGSSRSANVSNGCRLINGTVLYPGEEFSAYEAVRPISTENGYYLAGSYLNGQVVESLGGGICQVSSTLYNAVLRAELQVTERHNHSLIVSYVDKSADAAIAESAGKDFRFVNNTEHPIYIEGYTQDKKITFNIYGVETRDPGHTVEFKSEIISETQPPADRIIPDAGQVVGYMSVQSAHIGYTAKLWKITYENGTEVGREVVNESKYNMTPRTAVVGIASPEPLYAQRMQSAIDTGSIDECKAAIAQIQAHAAAAAELAAQAQQQGSEAPQVVTEPSGDAAAP
ncbi:MAG: VanW family protein [Lachnospiraceae bacterium]|nr:VanW family protein [Lachnospiraceae bacterium]